MYPSSYCVLSDQATIVGVNNADRNTIVKEKITEHSVPIITYTANFKYVYTLAVDEANNVLFAGGYNGRKGLVLQYDLNTGQAIKNYGQVGIGTVVSNTRVENLLFLGGCRSHKFTVIDSVRRQVAHEPVNAAVSVLSSLAVASVQKNQQNPKLLLFTVGHLLENSNNWAGVFDITEVVNKHKISRRNCLKVTTSQKQPLFEQA